VTRLAFRRARGQRRNEEAVTSLKAYRVEFIEPLTEYPGTENGRGEHQNVFMSGSLDALRACCKFKSPVGQVDAEKLAQRSSVAA
jgi:hypothetical protein